ncbi:MAG: HD domain-containing phosphohydrolase [Bryobacteraceae bacterium]
MTLRARAYIVSVTAAGATVLGYGLWSWHSTDWARYLFLLAVSILAPGMKVSLSGGAGTLSLNFLLILIGIGSLSLGETLAMGSAGILVERFYHASHRPGAFQTVFNVAGMALSVGTAYGAYHAALRFGEWFQLPVLLMLAAGVFYLSNTLSAALVIALTEGKSPWPVWRETYFWSFPNYLLGAAVAWVLSAVSRVLGWQASLLLLPVLFALYRSHRQCVDRLQEQRRYAEEQQAQAQQLAALHRRTIETLAVAVEAKHQATHDHLARVEVYALAIGRELGLSEDELKALEAAALLHDIGKVAVPEQIISKPGRLTRDEFEKMKIHPVVGAELVERVDFPYPVAPIVRAHHEKWNGNGYPDGLAGENIPIGARILAAVDCLDALATDRQYRRALPLDEAVAVVKKEAGISYDPRVVEILSRRCVELEGKAKRSAMAQRARLSTHVKVKRGAAPAAGFEESADETANDLVRFHLSLEAAASLPAGTEESRQRSVAPSGRAEIFAELRESLLRQVPYASLAVFLRQGNRLVAEFVDGEGRDRFASLEVPMGRGLAGWVAEFATAIINGDPSVEPGFVNQPPLGSALAVPVESSTGAAGVLSLYRRERNAFRTSELRVLFSVATRLSRQLDLLAQPQ